MALISIFATKYAMSKSFSSFEATSLFSCLNARGMLASCGLAVIRMASAALLCPKDPAWLLRDSNLKFAQPPETNTDDESDKFGFSPQTVQNMAPSRCSTHGNSVFQDDKNFRFGGGRLPCSLGLLWSFSEGLNVLFLFPLTKNPLMSITRSASCQMYTFSQLHSFRALEENSREILTEPPPKRRKEWFKDIIVYKL